MNTHEYRRACSYARKLTNDYRDIVHDAYLDYYNRVGGDLFDAPNKTIIVTVRNHYYNSIRRNRFMYEGEYHQKRNYSMNNEDSVKEGTTQQEYIEAKFNLYSCSLMDEIINKDQIEKVNKMLTPKQEEVFNHLVEGYTIQDIADIKEINQSSVRKTSGYIKDKARVILAI